MLTKSESRHHPGKDDRSSEANTDCRASQEVSIEVFNFLKKGHVHGLRMVFKNGRTMGATWGVISEVEAEIGFMDEDGTQRKYRAWEVLPRLMDRKTLRDFCLPGGCGSLVLDVGGSVCGLLFGHPDVTKGIGERRVLRFITTIDLIIEDIESLTRCKVSLP